MFFFFFSSRRRHTRSLRDWSSDVCSSDLLLFAVFAVGWHRVILLGIHQAGRGLGVQLGGRELRYFGRLWICFLGSIAIATAFTAVEQLIGAAVAASPENFILAAEVSYVLASAYIFCRIGPAF